jgi:hypothetical protein
MKQLNPVGLLPEGTSLSSLNLVNTIELPGGEGHQMAIVNE